MSSVGCSTSSTDSVPSGLVMTTRYRPAARSRVISYRSFSPFRSKNQIINAAGYNERMLSQQRKHRSLSGARVTLVR